MRHGAVLIIGATSPIAEGAAKEFAARGFPLYLASRDNKELAKIAADLTIRHQVTVKTASFDVEKIEEHLLFFRQVVEQMGSIYGVLSAVGDLGDQKDGEEDFFEAKKIIDCNFTGVCSLLTHAANYLEQKKEGFIIGISSVAGDRGRQSNYLYGSAKGGLSLFLQGMRNRLYPHGVRVITIKPGFVDTAMTFGKPGVFLVADPKKIGRAIAGSYRGFFDIRYLPWFWFFIMGIIRFFPEALFKRLKL